MNAILIPGLTSDDKVPGFYPYLNLGVGRASVGAFPVYCNLVGNKRPGEIGSITRSGGTNGPAITASGEPTLSGDYIVEITTGGAVGTAEFKWSDDDGDSYTEGVTTASDVELSNGVSVQFPAGTYEVGEIYSFTATSYGTAEYDTLYDVFTAEESETLFGAGSELDAMCKAALDIDGVSLRAMAVEVSDGSSQATLTITISGTWSENGQVGLRVAGRTYRVGVTSDDSTSDVATRLSDEIDGDDDALVDSAASSSTITLTFKTPGLRGNTISAWKLLGLAPTGLKMALSGGTALTGGGVPFSGGSGTDDVTSPLAALLPVTVPLYDFYGFAHQDAVNLALIETQLDEKAGPLVADYEQAVFAVNGTQSAAISLSQTTLNHELSMLLLDEEGESFPPAMAAQFAAERAVTEGSNPHPDYDGMVLPSMAKRDQLASSKDPNHSKLKAQLNAGVTPTITENGEKKIVRAITTKCLKGSSPFYGTIEPGDVTVPMRGSRMLSVEWAVFKAGNPKAGPDPDVAEGERSAPEGVGTPNLWKVKCNGVLSEMQANGWIYQVAQNPPSTNWDDDAERIMAQVPLKVRPINHQVGQELRQLA